MPRRPIPLISTYELQPSTPAPYTPDDAYGDLKPRTFWQYLPALAVVILILLPHPSYLIMLVDYHLKTRNDPIAFTIHLIIAYTLTFLAFSSFIVCITRDPGVVQQPEPSDEDTQALLTPADDDFLSPGKWCRKCWGPKPERTHHCSTCGRCVLKMDHHCPWMASKCIGYNTYPAFVHFLVSCTLLALYIAVVSIFALIYAFSNPYALAEPSSTPIHEIFLAFDGLIFSLVMGSFLGYHIYLISTNQTTVENISHFFLLRYLPTPPEESTPDAQPTSRRPLAFPPMEHELSYQQRTLVRAAHGAIHIYDVGFSQNWAQVYGWSKSRDWMKKLLNGGSSPGDGRTFPRHSRSEGQLEKLARELIELEKDR